jgi:hypothetical protein
VSLALPSTSETSRLPHGARAGSRLGWAAALLLVGLGSALLVARLPADPERRIVTRRHHNSDPLLTAAQLRINVGSLLHDPARYFQPPILFPDPNPYRSTEPLIAETLFTLPFRLLLGDRPALVYTSVLIATLALVAAGTALMLRELGTRPSLALLGGGLTVLIGTTTIFVDRLQAVSFQWLPLGIYSAVRFWRRGAPAAAFAFAACCFLTAQASLYTAVMLVAAALFVWPALASLRRTPRALARSTALGAALAAAALLSLLVLRPYLRDRADVAPFASAAYAPHKSWNPASVANLLSSPPEYGRLGWPLEPPPSWDGFYPGAAFFLLLTILMGLSAAQHVRRRARDPAVVVSSRGFDASKRLLLSLLAALAGALVWSALAPGSGAARATCDLLLWCALLTWSVRLALWPATGPSEPMALGLFASTAGLAASALFVLSLGSPIAFAAGDPPLLQGVFAPLSGLMTPLREMRELKRFLLPAGWAAVVAAVLALERRLPPRPRGLAVVVTAVVFALGIGERIEADTRGINVPPLPETYALLESSLTGGGLLELPFENWGRVSSVKRMLWQPEHGRPTVSGKVSLDPGWYTPAKDVFAEFPSEESVRLLRAWGVGAVLDERADALRSALPATLPGGLVLRAWHERLEGAARLFDVLPRPATAIPPEPDPGAGHWTRPLGVPSPAAADAQLAVDGSHDTAAEVDGPDGLVVVLPAPAAVTALELDYGSGRFNRVPGRLAVHGLVDGVWADLTLAGGDLLRARAADQLLKTRSARLVITLRTSQVRQLRLVSETRPWDLPELRLRTLERE